MRRWLRVLFVGALALLVSIDSASACRFLRSRCRPRCRTVACFRPLPACSPCAAPAEIISIATPQCCVPADGSAHAEIVEPVHETIVDDVIESTAPAEAPANVVEKPAPTPEKPAPAPLTPVPVAPASAEQPVPAPQFKTAKEILEESAAKQAAEAKAAEEAKAAAEAKAAEAALAEEAAEPAAEEPGEPVKEEKPAAEEAPEEEPATEEPAEEPAEEEPAVEEPAPKQAAEDAPAEEEENLFDETDGDAGEKAEPAEEKSEEPKAEDDPFAGILRSPSEPVRRWIDNTGVHETIGRLVEVHPDHIRILKANGRHATVPLTRLSRHDRDYVTATGARIAAEQRSQPAVHDTAGL